ncbi:tRNA (guanine(46)-N(7))-methyltransferase TrmB [Vulgatibacter sp.]|uniref:tRNA (guanine(46)-N(7))-methyltransferase TrmB n=1 Tax=Vulgatibacter sp. TaxID=1971226 RepID=UPI0035662DCD
MMETSRDPRGPLDLASLLDWSKVFGRPAPLEVEIGSGQGGFALGHSAAHPEVNLVAFEVRRKFARETAEKGEARGLTNLRCFAADAKVVLPRIFAPRSVDVFHIQFPDPWWKKKHHGRRLVEDEFSILLYNLLRLDGLLEVRTDVEGRGVEMAAALEAVGFVNRFGAGQLAPYDPSEVPSTRERGYLARGEPIYRYKFGRTAAPPHRAQAPLPETTVGPEQRRR